MFNSKLRNFSLGKSLGMSLVLLAFVVGCGEQTEQQVMVQQAMKIEQADSCHLCGMIISNFPGPKGESYASTQDDINKFCSTRDLFGFILQPENKRQVKEVFVHDMSKPLGVNRTTSTSLMPNRLGLSSVPLKLVQWGKR